MWTDSWRGLYLPDFEDGKTTSPQSPPFKTVNEPMSSASSHPHSLTLDRSRSAPASMNQGVTPVEISTPIESSQLQPLTVDEPSPDPSDDTIRSQSQGLADAKSSSLQTDADAPIPSTLPSQEPFSSTVPEDNEVTSSIVSGDYNNPMDTVLGKSVTSSGTVSAESPFIVFNPSSQTQTLDQEMDMDVSYNAKPEIGHDFPDQFQSTQGDVTEDVSGAHSQLMSVPDFNLEPCSAEPGTSSVPPDSEKSVIPYEKDQSEADNIPPLAQALKELHKLLMSSSWPTVSERTPLSHPNVTAPRLDGDELKQDPDARNHVTLNRTADSFSNTATTDDKEEESVAKADLTSRSVRDSPDLHSSNSWHTENQLSTQADPIVEQSIQHPLPGGNQDLDFEEGSVPVTTSQEDCELPEDQQGNDIMGEKTSGIDISADLSQQHPLSIAAGPSTNTSLGPVASPQSRAPEMDPVFLGDAIQPAPQPSMGQFPLEHIHRIQASGFSAREAAEALEQAQGSVELALLVLLARNITVPT